MSMKKITFAILILLALLAACSYSEPAPEPTEDAVPSPVIEEREIPEVNPAPTVAVTPRVSPTPKIIHIPRDINIILKRNEYGLGETVTFDVLMDPDDGALYTVNVVNNGLPDAEPKVVLNNSFVTDTAGTHIITVVSGDDYASTEFLVFDMDGLALETFILTNITRESNGLRPLKYDERLDTAAQNRVHEIVEYFSHTRPDGRFFNTAFREARVGGRNWAENLASGQETPQEAIDGWMGSDSHREAMLSKDYLYLGIGVYMDDSGTFYWVQTFRD